jgi:N-acetylglucosamine-6-sulfatase
VTRLLRVLLLVAVVLSGLLAAAGGALAAGRPNVVVIMLDDVPALDGRLVEHMPAAKGLFVDHGAWLAGFEAESPLCCPARAGFLTGLHTHHHGVIRNQASLFDPSMTIATALHDQGYFTMLAGKYLNGCADVCAEDPPGWDDFAAFWQPAYYDYHVWRNRVARSYGSAASDYSTDVVAGLAVDELRAAPAAQPVFAWIAPFAGHEPITPAPRYEGDPRCSKRDAWTQWAPPNYNEADVSDKPAYVRALPLQRRGKHELAQACQTLLAADDLIGRVRDELAAEGRLSNTVFWLFGDNGMSSGSHRLEGKQAPYITAVPAYVSWPAGGINSPERFETLLQNIDFAPTVCELAGCTLGPYPDGQATPDGVSFAPLLEAGVAPARTQVLDEELDPDSGVGNPPWHALRTTSRDPLGQWHYIEYADGERELYNTLLDPFEMQNLLQPPTSGGEAIAAILASDLATLEAS